ncbi:MAG: enoyl-CoA hydratase-related protein, partial [Pseudonocardiaceae bacterium]
MGEHIRSSLDGVPEATTATIALDSPHNRNALSERLLKELSSELARARRREVRAVVLSHTGNVFCSGIDMRAPTGPPVVALADVLTQLW